MIAHRPEDGWTALTNSPRWPNNLRAAYESLYEEFKRLEAENKQLRADLKYTLGQGLRI